MSERLGKYIQNDQDAMKRVLEAMAAEERNSAEAEQIAEKLHKRTNFNRRFLFPATTTIIAGMFTEILLTPHGLSADQAWVGIPLSITMIATIFENMFSIDQVKEFREELNKKISKLSAYRLREIILESRNNKKLTVNKPKRNLTIGDDGELKLDVTNSDIPLKHHL